MVNFPCNLMLFLPAGMHVEHGWQWLARSRVALGGEPVCRHKQYAILELEPEPAPAQVMGLLHEVSAFLEHDFGVRVMLAFPSPLGLGLFQLEDVVQRENLLDASPINFGQWVVTVRKHDEARNFRTCNYIRECWVMFLGFPLDYQSVEFVKASVAPFGQLLSWYEGPNKSRILTKCLILSLD
jgi:hypothetical protein